MMKLEHKAVYLYHLKRLLIFFFLMPFFPTSLAIAQEDKTIVIMPKLVGISYYDVVHKGVLEASRDLPNLNVKWMGPTQDIVEKQIEMLEQVIETKPDVIAVAANDPAAIVPVLKKAKAAGIQVMSWDGDANFRDFFVNLVNFTDFGNSVIQDLVEQIPSNGDIAIITTSFTSPNQARWIKEIKKNIYTNALRYNIVDIRPAGESMEEAHRIARDFMKEYPRLKGIIALGVPNLPGAARAVKEEGKSGQIAVIGNSTPNLMREYLKDGTVQKVHLWNAPDHGYLTVYSAYHLLQGTLELGKPFKVGRLGMFAPLRDDTNMQVALPVLTFTKENVDNYDF